VCVVVSLRHKLLVIHQTTTFGGGNQSLQGRSRGPCLRYWPGFSAGSMSFYEYCEDLVYFLVKGLKVVWISGVGDEVSPTW
jgi:hypothetical protein